ncbi:MAG: hypothetical protein ATN35_06130 [Epulopiscium sp. Nele67-Bin004]|nr:MAG: hypothetical protein ATN35_06130 [Epulopiscium sp. Nele67-Bin004]
MGLQQLFILAVGLSMDAFAVSICKGLQGATFKSAIQVGFYFGGFQAFMPILGYYLGDRFYDIIAPFDHWIIFGILTIIGVKMIKEASDRAEDDMPQSLLMLAIATSIDALAVGISLALLNVDIMHSAGVIGVTTFCLSVIGVFIGAKIGSKFKAKSEIVGGLILIGIGVKTLVEHISQSGLN